MEQRQSRCVGEDNALKEELQGSFRRWQRVNVRPYVNSIFLLTLADCQAENTSRNSLNAWMFILCEHVGKQLSSANGRTVMQSETERRPLMRRRLNKDLESF